MSDNETMAWLNALLESLDLGVHAVNLQGITVFYNQRAANLDGVEPNEVIGRHVLDVFPSLSEETSSLLRVLRTQETISHREQSYRNYRGDLVHTSNATRPVFYDGSQIGALEVAMDITEVKHLAEQVVDLQAAVIPADKRKGDLKARKTGAIWTLADVLTGAESVRQVIAKARKIASTSSPVLVYGETGTGKELLVQGIHNASPRANQPFIAQNCAALPGSLLEGILFGTVKGSFTGAENREGLFELASGGTLFLDELNSMPLDLQAKLLRVIEEKQVRRLGDKRLIPVDVRIMAAMNVDPEDAISHGDLRPDLYYRVRVVALHLPPLAERFGDIALLINYFISDYNQKFGKHVIGLTREAEEILFHASWKGNVRELKHALEAAMNEVDQGRIDTGHLPAYILKEAALGGGDPTLHKTGASATSGAPAVRSALQQFDEGPEPVATDQNAEFVNLNELLDNYEKEWLMRALERSDWNLTHAAKMLGIPRQTLQSKMKKHRITP